MQVKNKSLINKSFILKSILKCIMLAVVVLMVLITYFTTNLPQSFYLKKNDTLKLDSLNMVVSSSAQNGNIGKADFVSSAQNKSTTSTLKLFGIFPIKTVQIERIDSTILHAGGDAFGIKLYTNGVLVINVSSVISNKMSSSPAKDAGIKQGDYILSMNAYPVASNEDVKHVITKSNGSPINITYRRESQVLNTTLTPIKADIDGLYKGAFWVRDSTAGIGTMTFYDPKTLRFAGLGHAINDADSDTLLDVKTGDLCGVTINNIVKGKAGTPGELGGYFNSKVASGAIVKNNQTGLYGYLFKPLENAREIPLGLKQSVRTGKAQILCTLDGTTPQLYDIEISDIELNSKQITKNMTIKVTDSALLDKTGGIVQGMSGSPIIQNGCLIGAVTHVFVNNPTKGYAIFAENMYAQLITDSDME